ncbi:MAG TPA: sigma factor, partial [Myxococcota bacterium]|nr:sigma factor [Myxococcota bacterium]
AEPRVRGSLRTFAAEVDVEAVLQEALLRAWQVAPRVQRDGRGDSLLRYAARVAHNLAIDEVRRAGRSRALAPDEDVAAPEVEPPDPRLGQQVRRCLEELPEQPRRAISARWELGATEHDRSLADRLGMQLNTFLKNIGRAREALKQCLERAGVAMGGA